MTTYVSCERCLSALCLRGIYTLVSSAWRADLERGEGFISTVISSCVDTRDYLPSKRYTSPNQETPRLRIASVTMSTDIKVAITGVPTTPSSNGKLAFTCLPLSSLPLHTYIHPTTIISHTNLTLATEQEPSPSATNSATSRPITQINSTSTSSASPTSRV